VSLETRLASTPRVPSRLIALLPLERPSNWRRVAELYALAVRAHAGLESVADVMEEGSTHRRLWVLCCVAQGHLSVEQVAAYKGAPVGSIRNIYDRAAQFREHSPALVRMVQERYIKGVLALLDAWRDAVAELNDAEPEQVFEAADLVTKFVFLAVVHGELPIEHVAVYAGRTVDQVSNAIIECRKRCRAHFNGQPNRRVSLMQTEEIQQTRQMVRQRVTGDLAGWAVAEQ